MTIPTEDGLPPLPEARGYLASKYDEFADVWEEDAYTPAMYAERKDRPGYSPWTPLFTADQMRDYARAALASRAAAMAPEGEQRFIVTSIKHKAGIVTLCTINAEDVLPPLESGQEVILAAAPSSEAHGVEAPAHDMVPRSRLKAVEAELQEAKSELARVREVARPYIEAALSAPPAGHASIPAPGAGTAAEPTPAKPKKLQVTLQDSPTEWMFDAAIRSLAQISQALDIPEEEAACANGNSLILEAIADLKARAGGSVVRQVPLTDELRKLLTVDRPVHIPGTSPASPSPEESSQREAEGPQHGS